MIAFGDPQTTTTGTTTVYIYPIGDVTSSGWVKGWADEFWHLRDELRKNMYVPRPVEAPEYRAPPRQTFRARHGYQDMARIPCYRVVRRR